MQTSLFSSRQAAPKNLYFHWFSITGSSIVLAIESLLCFYVYCFHSQSCEALERAAFRAFISHIGSSVRLTVYTCLGIKIHGGTMQRSPQYPLGTKSLNSGVRLCSSLSILYTAVWNRVWDKRGLRFTFRMISWF